MTDELTSIHALAELIEGEINPKAGDYNKIDFEDIVERVRNSYSGVLRDFYLQNLDEADRLIHTVLTTRAEYKIQPTDRFLLLAGAQVVDLDRDAGMYMVIASGGEGCDHQSKPLLRSTPSAAYESQHRIAIAERYYRIGNGLHFPDGLPCKTEKIDVLFYGVLENNDSQMNISRTVADLVIKDVKNSYLQSAQIKTDVTQNKNPNQ